MLKEIRRYKERAKSKMKSNKKIERTREKTTGNRENEIKNSASRKRKALKKIGRITGDNQMDVKDIQGEGQMMMLMGSILDRRLTAIKNQ